MKLIGGDGSQTRLSLAVETLFHGMPGGSTSGIVRESTTPCWEKYLYQEKADPKKLDLSGSFTRKRYTGIVNPNVEILDIVTVLARADINYTPEEYPAEQPYIDNRLIPHMRTTKLPFPVIEIYTRDAVDNQRPHLPSGKRPFTDIHIIDGAHRIVALKKMGIKEIPFIVYREPGGNLMVKEGTTPAPEPANKEFRANPSLVNKQAAYAAHRGTSFEPEKRGEEAIRGFAEEVQAIYERLKPHARTDAEKALLIAEMERFQAAYAQKYNDLLYAHSRIVSTMIAGPSGFPTERMRKINEAYDNKSRETYEWKDRAEKAMLRALKGLATEEAGGEVAVLKTRIAQAEKLQEMMVEGNKIIRKKAEPGIGGVSKHQQLINLGFTERQAAEALKPDYMGRIGFPSFALTNNSANIRRMKECLIELEKREVTPTAEIPFTGGRIVDNREADRVQIIFDQKPAQEVINKLRSEGWRWSPSIGAWQRKRTDYAMMSARRITGAAQPPTPAVQPAVTPMPVTEPKIPPELVTLLNRYKKHQEKVDEISKQTDAILQTSAVGQAPPVFHRLVDKQLDIIKRDISPIWDILKDYIVPNTNFKTFWQETRLTLGALPPSYQEIETVLNKYNVKIPVGEQKAQVPQAAPPVTAPQPPDIGTQPENPVRTERWVLRSKTPLGFDAFGWAEYDRPLTSDEIRHFELFVDEPVLPKLVKELVQFAHDEGIDEAMRAIKPDDEYYRAVMAWLKVTGRERMQVDPMVQIREEVIRLAGMKPPLESGMEVLERFPTKSFLEPKIRDYGKWIRENTYGEAGVRRLQTGSYEQVIATIKEFIRKYYNLAPAPADYIFRRPKYQQTEIGIDSLATTFFNVAANGWDLAESFKEWEAGETRQEWKRRLKEVEKPLPTKPVEVAKPMETIQETKQKLLQRIQSAGTVTELQSILKEIGAANLPEHEKQQLLDMYQNRFSMLKTEEKPKILGAPSRQELWEEELRKKAEEGKRLRGQVTIGGAVSTAARLGLFEPGAMEKARAEAEARKRIEQLGLPYVIHPIIKKLAESKEYILKFGAVTGRETLEDLVLSRYKSYCPAGVIVDNRGIKGQKERWWVYPDRLRACITEVQQKIAAVPAAVVAVVKESALSPSTRNYIRGAQAVRDVIHYFMDRRPPVRGVLYRARDGTYFVEAQDGQIYASMGWEDVYGAGMPAARAGAVCR